MKGRIVMNNVYQKLLKVQSELKAPKKQNNKFGNYNYRSCEDIQEAVKPLLKEVGAVLVISDEIKQIQDRFYVEATVKFINCEDNATIENKALAREELVKKGMDSSQITGSASSYARKYALNGLLCIDDTKDSDTTNLGENLRGATTKKAMPKPKTSQPNQVSDRELDETQAEISGQKINAVKVSVIKNQLGRTGVSETAICSRYKITTLEDITETQFTKVMNALEKTKTKGE